MEDRKHHAFGPSVLGRRAMCPGSAELEAKCEAVESDAAAEGTKLHEAVYDDAIAEKLSDEDFALVQRARSFLDTLLGEGTWQFEERIAVVNKKGDEILHGYADAIRYDHKHKQAHVVDFKFGWLDLPQKMATWQLAALCVGVEQMCGYPTQGYIYCPRTDETYPSPRYEVDATVAKIESVIKRCES